MAGPQAREASMRSKRATTALTWMVLAAAAVPSFAQAGRDACLDAARALVRQQARWEESRERGGMRLEDVLRWRAADGSYGYCRIDNRGMVYEVRVESWARGGSGGYPGGGYPGGGTPGYPGSSNRDFTEEFGYDRRGSDYRTADVRSLAACQAECRADNRCVAYTFSASQGRCWLKSSIQQAQISRDMVTGYRRQGTGGWDDDDDDDWDDNDDWDDEDGRLSEEWDLDRRGNDYDNFTVRNLGECQEECRDDSRCRAYTFDTRTRTCYVKDRVNTAQRNQGMVTGYKQ
jgi:hypothetical protein